MNVSRWKIAFANQGCGNQGGSGICAEPSAFACFPSRGLFPNKKFPRGPRLAKGFGLAEDDSKPPAHWLPTKTRVKGRTEVTKKNRLMKDSQRGKVRPMRNRGEQNNEHVSSR